VEINLFASARNGNSRSADTWACEKKTPQYAVRNIVRSPQQIMSREHEQYESPLHVMLRTAQAICIRL
jgi:serine phosphatase RsbU (regulator of sigma subunit)